MSHTAVYMHFNLLNTNRHCMYDAGDRWALRFSRHCRHGDSPSKATCLYIVNVMYLQLFCIAFRFCFVFFFSNPFLDPVCFVEVFSSVGWILRSPPPVQVCNIFECSCLWTFFNVCHIALGLLYHWMYKL